MRKATHIGQTIVAVAILVTVGHIQTVGEDLKATEGAKGLMLSTRDERIKAVTALAAKYAAIEREVLGHLQGEVRKGTTNREYYSPLHCAILTVSVWRVVEAESMLISIVDYHLDVSSVPLFADVLPPQLYPAALALVELRVDSRRVVEAIKTAAGPDQVRILTWVLFRRSSTNLAAKMLDDEAKRSIGRSKDNLLRAAATIDKGENLLQTEPSK